MILRRKSVEERVEFFGAKGAGRLYHSQEIGGLVQWVLAMPGEDSRVAFVDQRFELIPDEIWSDYFALASGGNRTASLLEKWQVGTALISESEQGGLIDWMEEHPDWVKVAQEMTYHLYMRADRVPKSWTNVDVGG